MKLNHAPFKLKSGNFSIERQDLQNIGLNERLASMFIGGALLNRSITNPFKKRFLYGAYLTYRGITGNCLVYERLGINATKPHAVNVRGEFIIDKPANEVYAYWRNLSNLPLGIQHLMEVKMIDEHQSSWKSAVLSHILPLKWNAEIVKDEPGRLIGWRGSNGSIFHHVGKVEFEPTTDGLGTVLKIVLSYHPPIGGVGIILAKYINPLLEQLLKKEIINFKHTIEHPSPLLN